MEMPRASAASCLVKPAKNRSLTSSAARASLAWSLIEQFAQGEQIEVRALNLRRDVRQFNAAKPAAGFRPAFAARVFDQNPPHGLGRGGEEVAAAVPVLAA